MQSWGAVEWVLATVSAVSGIMIYITQIGPKQAVSHAAEWIEAFGIPTPEWFKSGETDRVIRNVAGLVLLICALLLAIQVIDLGAMHPLSKILFVLAAIAACGGILVNLFRPEWVGVFRQPSFLLVLLFTAGLALAVWGHFRQTPQTGHGSVFDGVIPSLQAERDVLKKKLQDTEAELAEAKIRATPQPIIAPSPASQIPENFARGLRYVQLSKQLSRAKEIRKVLEAAGLQARSGVVPDRNLVVTMRYARFFSGWDSATKELKAINDAVYPGKLFDLETAPELEIPTYKAPDEDRYADRPAEQYNYRKFHFRMVNIIKRADALIETMQKDFDALDAKIASDPTLHEMTQHLRN